MNVFLRYEYVMSSEWSLNPLRHFVQAYTPPRFGYNLFLRALRCLILAHLSGPSVRSATSFKHTLRLYAAFFSVSSLLDSGISLVVMLSSALSFLEFFMADDLLPL